MKISNIAERVEPSKGRELFNLASQYDNVINLTLGDPDIMTPMVVRQAGCDAIMQGKTRYSANAGLFELRETYAKYIKNEYKKCFDPMKEIIVTVGGMEALYLSLLCSVNPGDEVIIFSPYYINYYQMIIMCGGVPVIIETKEQNEFVPETIEIEKHITSKTKVIIINSPNNPTGAVYPNVVIEETINIASKHKLLLISDEVYSMLVFDKVEHYSVMQSAAEYQDILLIDSCSKKFSMTGWRVGFATGTSELIQAMTKLQENIAACAPLPSQYAAIAAFDQKPDMSVCVSEFYKRRNFIVEAINSIDKLSCNLPKGTYYVFVNIRETGLKSLDFAINLLKMGQVAVVPGIAYGDMFDDYIRIALTLEETKLEEAVNKIKKFVNEL